MVKRIDVSTPKHPNTYALVDDEDYERLVFFLGKHRKWRCHKRRNHRYAGTVVKGKTYHMHRVVLDVKDGVIVDHKNRDGLDNRKENLSVCSASQNAVNSVRRESKSGFKGVHWHERYNGWRARFCVDYCDRTIGFFRSPYIAAAAYDLLASKHHGGFLLTNATIQKQKSEDALRRYIERIHRDLRDNRNAAQFLNAAIRANDAQIVFAALETISDARKVARADGGHAKSICVLIEYLQRFGLFPVTQPAPTKPR